MCNIKKQVFVSDTVDVSKLHPELAIGRLDHVIDDKEKRFRGYPDQSAPEQTLGQKSKTFKFLQHQLGEN